MLAKLNHRKVPVKGSKPDLQHAAVKAAMRKALELHSRIGPDARKHALIPSLLKEYADALAASRQVMQRSGMADICSACASEVPGGCCFRGVEDWYDPVLLLINILLGAELPDEEAVSDNCMFLGEKGCRIPARYHFCVNYLCGRLWRGIDPAMMREAAAATGRELSSGAELEYALRRLIYSKGLDPDNVPVID